MLINYISYPIINILQFLLCFLLCKKHRMINGLQTLLQAKDIDIFIYISISILIAISFFTGDTPINVIYLIPIFFCYLLGITFFLLLKSRIMKTYLEKLKTKEIVSLTEEIEKLKTDNNTMARQIHKDNKMLPVMQLSVIELIREYGETDKLKHLQTELETLAKERYSILENTENHGTFCNISSTDAIFKYYTNKAKQENVNFKVSLEPNVLENLGIPTNDLNTLLCDLCENAMIAVRDEEHKNILVHIESKEKKLVISIFDNGSPFAKEVLENMGNRKITTHADTGGSGIGLVTVFDIVKRWKGTFHIEKCTPDSIYTKCVVVTIQ